jgi:plasmid stabilization system protein ParE
VNVRLTPEAEQDVGEAISWYDQKSMSLGDEFLKYVNKCIQSIERYPEMYPRVHRRMRRALLETFPYQVIYDIDPNEIIVYAIYHCARDPESWKKRLPA